MMEKKTKEELESDLMYQTQMLIWRRGYSDKKKLATERYMRSYIKALTIGELKRYIDFINRNGVYHVDIVHKVDQASEGYDKFMQNRGISY
ncbi:hypothetical protein ACFLVC_05065 [Chloroflexota bacterium]